MANIILQKDWTPEGQLAQMQEDAKFDIADNDEALVPDLAFLKGKIRVKGSPPKAPKVFLSNDCSFNCAYCGCRGSADRQRYCMEPRKLAELAVQDAKKSGCGIFITSAIYKNANETQQRIIETLRALRQELGYRGYLHAKIMPGADPLLIHQTGVYANRLSVNIEVAKSEGYEKIAKNKNKANILTPMGQISQQIKMAKAEKSRFSSPFATSQTTQLMAGSTGEDDFTILNLAGALYKKYRLNRVYYTPYHYTSPATGYEEMPAVDTPAWRVRRLYQADRLMQLYGFTADEIVPESARFLSEDLDPKAAWALRNLHLFPVEVNKAGYDALLRVPGIGTVYASRILEARKYCTITHDVLQAIGVSLKRCKHFITCDGKFIGNGSGNEAVLQGLLADSPKEPFKFYQSGCEF